MSPPASSRRALINEVGFECFCRCILEKCAPEDIGFDEIRAISDNVRRYISRLRAEAPRFDREIQDHEVSEARTIARRLRNIFTTYNIVQARPPFRGCGKINECNADIIADDVLYEVKAGGRNFRSLDLRQLALYATLNHFSRQYNIQRVGLYNPRQGFHFVTSAAEFSLHFCGLSAEEMYNRIGYYVAESDSDRLSWDGRG